VRKTSGRALVPTTTASLARLQVFQPTQRPRYTGGEWVTTAWGKSRVAGRLGQRHADLYEAIRWCAEARHERDGLVELLVDPYRVRKTLSSRGYSHRCMQQLLTELVQAEVEIVARDFRAAGSLIDSVAYSEEMRRNPLTGGKRPLWVVRLGPVARALDSRDLPLYYDPRPIARLQHGISQAIARHVLTHRQQPNGGWKLDTLIEIVAGETGGQSLRDWRRKVRADARGLHAAGIEVRGDRVRLLEERVGRAERRTARYQPVSNKYGGKYPKSGIEELLRKALEKLGITGGLRDFEIRDEAGVLVTVPDFAWPEARVAVYCDGYAYHGNRRALDLDARRRNWLQTRGWIVLTYWDASILRNPDECARQVADVLASRRTGLGKLIGVLREKIAGKLSRKGVPVAQSGSKTAWESSPGEDDDW